MSVTLVSAHNDIPRKKNKSINRNSNSNSGAFLRGRPPSKELQGQALFAAGRSRVLGALQPAQGERAAMREKTFALRGKDQKVSA